MLGECFHRSDHPVQLLGLANRSGARASRLTANIHNVSTLGQHLLGTRQQRIGVDASVAVELSAIGKRVWGYVENTHDAWTAKIQRSLTAGDGVEHLRKLLLSSEP